MVSRGSRVPGGTMGLSLLSLLVTGPLTPTELAAIERKHLSVVSRCLGKLRQDGLVEFEKGRARLRYYRPTEEGYVLAYASIRRLR